MPILPYRFNLLGITSLLLCATDRQHTQLCFVERHVSKGEAYIFRWSAVCGKGAMLLSRATGAAAPLGIQLMFHAEYPPAKTPDSNTSTGIMQAVGSAQIPSNERNTRTSHTVATHLRRCSLHRDLRVV